MIQFQVDQIESFKSRFVESSKQEYPGLLANSIDTDYFGDSPEMADQLLALILEGKKTATCSCLWQWEHDKEKPLEPGFLAAIIDGRGLARCVIETVSVQITAYNMVETAFAYEEGEGDRSLLYWRKEHWDFFSRTLPKIGMKPTEDMPLLCERFRVVYQEASR